MNRTKLAKVALGVVGLGIGVTAVLALREATLSTHDDDVAPRAELVVSAKTSNVERGQTVGEMVEAQLLTCRLEINSDLAGPIEALGDDHFRAVLVPGLDETNRRQFRGCVEDFVTDGLQMDVLELENVD